MGSLAFEKPVEGQIISGVLVKRNFKYQIVAPSDISSTSLYFNQDMHTLMLITWLEQSIQT